MCKVNLSIKKINCGRCDQCLFIVENEIFAFDLTGILNKHIQIRNGMNDIVVV
jgi:hypothetical protein